MSTNRQLQNYHYLQFKRSDLAEKKNSFFMDPLSKTKIITALTKLQLIVQRYLKEATNTLHFRFKSDTEPSEYTSPRDGISYTHF